MKTKIIIIIFLVLLVAIAGYFYVTNSPNKASRDSGPQTQNYGENPENTVADGYNPDGTLIKEGNNNGDIVNNTIKQINDSLQNVSEKKSRFDVYPETSSAPVLHMYWGEEKTAEIPLEEVNFIGRFGVWENLMGNSIFKPGFETATEFEIHTTNKKQPIYAFASGTITQINIEERSAEISVRYGTDYAMKYSVVNYNQNLTENSRVESGDFLGYTGWFEASNQPSYGFFEFEFNKRINGFARAIPPIDYFDAESKASLEKLPAKFGFSGWVVDPNDKKAGWVAYVGEPVGWATSMPLDIPGDDLKEYYTQYGMGFIFK
jgi:hypothetical protein